jgi:methylase of polypeptide subunit release factors
MTTPFLSDYADTADAALFHLACAVRNAGYRFTTVTPATHERVNSRPGNEWACDMEGVFGWSRSFRARILPPAIFELMQRADVAVRHGAGWRSLVRLSSLNSQLFLHSAYPTVDADAVFFGPDTYRFATAIMSHLASGVRVIGRAVDIGCGAGPGAVLIALAQPDAEVLAVDINHAALRCTRINAALAGVGNVEARHSNLLTGVKGVFDLIVANPPYLVDPAERAYRHGGGPLGAGLSLAIVDAALERLAPGGTLLLYTGSAMVNGADPFLEATKKRLALCDVAWSYREVDPDVFGEELLSGAYADADRIAAVVLTATRRGSAQER